MQEHHPSAAVVVPLNSRSGSQPINLARREAIFALCDDWEASHDAILDLGEVEWPVKPAVVVEAQAAFDRLRARLDVIATLGLPDAVTQPAAHAA